MSDEVERLERIAERLRTDTPFWAERFAKIIDKGRRKVPLVPNAGQLAFDALVERQRLEGKPMRIIALKARQVGISTWIQAKLIQRATQFENYNTMTVAQDRKTGPKLYRMGELMYENLPADVQPPKGSYSAGATMHFGDKNRGRWEEGSAFPNSTYEVDTAKEGTAGRGATPAAFHGSECAFWGDMDLKLTAALNGVPDEPETFVALESTANGHNDFKEWWDRAVAGDSEFVAFFWPWFRQEEYRLEFPSDAEKEAFANNVGSGPYGEEEPDLLDTYGLSLEQLHWRRQKISGGDLRNFHQEYPTTAEQAFLSTGRKTFDSYQVARLIRRTDRTDPRVPDELSPGPAVGEFKATSVRTEEGANGPVRIPNGALWVPRASRQQHAPWKLWLPEGELRTAEDESGPKGTFVGGVDPSGGEMQTTDEPDYHAMQFINHRTRVQVAEFRNRSMHPDEVAYQALLAALYFNNAWIAVERTGGWGLPVLRPLHLTFHYPFLYRSKRFGSTTEKSEAKYGWHTGPVTKPLLISGTQELMRDENHMAGIRSATVASEMNTYVTDERGRTNAGPKAYDDALMAYMIAQMVAGEIPFMDQDDNEPIPPPMTGMAPGLSAYDSRF